VSVYDELVNETGFDPTAPGPQLDPWVPWSLRGAWEILLGRTDMTVWTAREAQRLNQLLSEETQVLSPVEVTVESQNSFMEDWLALGERRDDAKQ
jgi:hypothetical protein